MLVELLPIAHSFNELLSTGVPESVRCTLARCRNDRRRHCRWTGRRARKTHGSPRRKALQRNRRGNRRTTLWTMQSVRSGRETFPVFQLRDLICIAVDFNVITCMVHN